ncbi:MAG: hypothetical protein EOO51_05985 [Flavobacterium sp.]|nr:MAG: hypothetical protein EOO51_05985 [Flavobacterium sp.]
MKRIIILLCLLTLAGCKSKKTPAVPKPAPIPKVSKIDPEKVDEEQSNKAYDLGKRVLMTCNTSRFKPFTSSEATADVIKNTTQERLTKTCNNFRLKYGSFRDIHLVEVLRNRTNKTNIYRFKAAYEKKIANKELRVIMNDLNQVSAIKSLDWKDEFK